MGSLKKIESRKHMNTYRLIQKKNSDLENIVVDTTVIN